MSVLLLLQECLLSLIIRCNWIASSCIFGVSDLTISDYIYVSATNAEFENFFVFVFLLRDFSYDGNGSKISFSKPGTCVGIIYLLLHH
jgi:hypothetical protein